MKIIYNNLIPFKGFAAINLFGILFVRKGIKVSEEMLYVFFYVWYVVEWIVRLFKDSNAYRNISFEREAYANENNIDYLKNRKMYNWINFINL